MEFTKYLKRKTLKTTFDTKLQYKYTLGTDGISTNKFSEIIDEEITIIKRKVKNHTYNISPYKEQLILKSRTSNPRMISIPTNRDKLVLSALQRFITVKFKDKISDDNVSTKIYKIKQAIQSKKYDSFIKIDIKNFYPSINHELLLHQIQDVFTEEPYTLTLLSKAIKQSTISPKTPAKERVKYSNSVGVPQGLSISGTLAQIYLEGIDVKYKKKKDMKYFRFVDDILILCNKESIEKLQRSLKRDFKKLSLAIHDFSDNKNKSTFGQIDKPFEFLGYRFDDELITVRESSAQRMFENLNALFAQYKHEFLKDEKWLYRKLNFKITGCIIEGKRYGWIHYFSMINDYQLLFRLDKFIENKCKEFDLNYSKIKKYSRAIYEIRDKDSSYIMSTLKIKKHLLSAIALDLSSDVQNY